MEQTFKDITQGLGNVIDYINPSSDKFFLKDLWDFLKNIISYINPFSDNFLGNMIVEMFGSLFKNLFVPSQDKIDSLVDSVKSHFRFIDTIKTTATSLNNMFDNTEALPKMTLTLKNNKYYEGTITVIDLAWYAPYKEFGDLIISAFIYIFFFWRIFVNLPNIISGAGGGYNEIRTDYPEIKQGYISKKDLKDRRR